MKRILCSICIGTLALAVTAWGQEVSNRKAKSGNTTTVKSSGNTRAIAGSTAHVSTQPARVRASGNMAHRTRSSTTFANRNTVANRNNVRRINAGTTRERNALVANRQRNLNVNNQSNVFVNRRQNAAAISRQRNVTITNNWRSAQFRGPRYAAFRNYQRQWHDRSWWRSHFNTIVFVSGGWYYWNAGYWFPAWGYDPYAYYPYDGPIYAQNYVSPDQVVVDVQRQLQRDGYYYGAIDGALGPMTRRAIAAYQADHGLAVTSAIDEPTLETLGLV
jgi:Putative peptidoglycan binding domain